MKDNIGGYFELELKRCAEHHPAAIRLNTGRNAFEYILKSRGYKNVCLPYYICDAVIEPLKRNGIGYEYYSIDAGFKPLINFDEPGTALLYVNYFGVNDNNAEMVAGRFENVIIDNTQAFFAMPFGKTDAFYSARKFLGVSDGAYAYTPGVSDENMFAADVSYARYGHLLKRAECGPEIGFSEYQANERSLSNQPIKRMSVLTQKVLSSIDYENVQKTRKRNYLFLHEKLCRHNELELAETINAPMVYPLLISRNGLRDFLAQNRIYAATYWNEVQARVEKNSFEWRLSKFLVPLPLDQRYSLDDMKRIIDIIGRWRECA